MEITLGLSQSTLQYLATTICCHVIADPHRAHDLHDHLRSLIDLRCASLRSAEHLGVLVEMSSGSSDDLRTLAALALEEMLAVEKTESGAKA